MSKHLFVGALAFALVLYPWNSTRADRDSLQGLVLASGSLSITALEEDDAIVFPRDIALDHEFAVAGDWGYSYVFQNGHLIHPNEVDENEPSCTFHVKAVTDTLTTRVFSLDRPYRKVEWVHKRRSFTGKPYLDWYDVATNPRFLVSGSPSRVQHDTPLGRTVYNSGVPLDLKCTPKNARRGDPFKKDLTLFEIQQAIGFDRVYFEIKPGKVRSPSFESGVESLELDPNALLEKMNSNSRLQDALEADERLATKSGESVQTLSDQDEQTSFTAMMAL